MFIFSDFCCSFCWKKKIVKIKNQDCFIFRKKKEKPIKFESTLLSLILFGRAPAESFHVISSIKRIYRKVLYASNNNSLKLVWTHAHGRARCRLCTRFTDPSMAYNRKSSSIKLLKHTHTHNFSSNSTGYPARIRQFKTAGWWSSSYVPRPHEINKSCWDTLYVRKQPNKSV